MGQDSSRVVNHSKGLARKAIDYSKMVFVGVHNPGYISLGVPIKDNNNFRNVKNLCLTYHQLLVLLINLFLCYKQLPLCTIQMNAHIIDILAFVFMTIRKL